MLIKAIKTLIVLSTLVVTMANAGFFSNLLSKEEPEQQRFHRMLYLKLPLKGVEFHWEFLDRKQLLNGELTLEFTAEGKPHVETIFENGKLNPNWTVISDTDVEDEKNNSLYFGFKSKKKYWFNHDDHAKITLTNAKPLQGWGPDFKAELSAGKHVMRSLQITQYEDDLYETPQELAAADAFLDLDDWAAHWPLSNQTEQGTGWHQE